MEDVVESKHEFENLAAMFPDQEEPMRTVLQMITKAPQLLPLGREEIHGILEKVQTFHGRTYGWNPSVSIETMAGVTESGGYLLRTKIRAAIEFLDQLYQYGEAD